MLQIVIAKLQQITIKHFLPSLGITENVLRSHVPKHDRATVAVEFFLAYRFGHDLVPDQIGSFDMISIFSSESFFDIKSSNGTATPAEVNTKMENLLQVRLPRVFSLFFGWPPSQLLTLFVGATTWCPTHLPEIRAGRCPGRSIAVASVDCDSLHAISCVPEARGSDRWRNTCALAPF